MNPDTCALILTSSVYVSAPYTVLTDPEDRKNQYIDSLLFFIGETPFKKIIVCDNSGFRYPLSLLELAAEFHKELELFSFNGNREMLAKQGKGYGEGEIMQYVLRNSLLIKKVQGFFKVTGRLKLINSDQLLRQCDEQQNYFMPVSLLRPRFMVPKAARACVDVRVYYVTVEFFKAVLLDAYKEVNDDQIYFLEHAYYNALARWGVSIKCFPVAPEITGISGSNGWVLKERSYFKKKLIRFISLLGYIRPVGK